MTINEYLEKWRVVEKFAGIDREFLKLRPFITCEDGFKISVQASETHYCTPRSNRGPYSKVECGYPSEREKDLLDYAEEPNNPTDTVYGWVPVDIIDAVIEKHGGIAK